MDPYGRALIAVALLTQSDQKGLPGYLHAKNGFV